MKTENLASDSHDQIAAGRCQRNSARDGSKQLTISLRWPFRRAKRTWSSADVRRCSNSSRTCALRASFSVSSRATNAAVWDDSLTWLRTTVGAYSCGQALDQERAQQALSRRSEAESLRFPDALEQAEKRGVGHFIEPSSPKTGRGSSLSVAVSELRTPCKRWPVFAPRRSLPRSYCLPQSPGFLPCPKPRRRRPGQSTYAQR